jgi:hypothetical protein
MANRAGYSVIISSMAQKEIAQSLEYWVPAFGTRIKNASKILIIFAFLNRGNYDLHNN